MKDRKEAPIKLNLDISSDENDLADQGVSKLNKRKGVSMDVLNFKTADSVERKGEIIEDEGLTSPSGFADFNQDLNPKKVIIGN